MARTEKTNIFKKHYDKILVGVVLLVLIVSLLMLMGLSNSQHQKESEFQSRISSLRPQFPKTEVASDAVYTRACTMLENPSALQTNQTAWLVASERMACVSCGWPIRLDDSVCAYCNAKQPGEVDQTGWDSDGDGMPDDWEKQYGLNPLSKDDALGDLDGDGFTNLEEYQAKTNPLDPKSFPPRVGYLRVAKILAVQFPFVLKGKQTLGAGNYAFQINEGSRSYFVRIGGEVGKSGWKAESFTNRMMVVKNKGMPDRKEALTVLCLTKGGERVEIIERGGPVWNSSEVTLICEKDRAMEPLVVKDREEFTFDGEQYQVLRIAKEKGSDTGSITIRKVSTKEVIQIPPQ